VTSALAGAACRMHALAKTPANKARLRRVRTDREEGICSGLVSLVASRQQEGVRLSRMRRSKRKHRRKSVAAKPVRAITIRPRVVEKSRSRALLAIGAMLVTVLCASAVDAAPAKKVASIPPPAVAKPIATKPAVKAVKFHFIPQKDRLPWGTALPSVSVTNNNTGAKGTFRIYSDHGSLDLEQMKQFMTVVNSGEGMSEKDTKLDTRLVQLAFRAAFHFNGAAMTIVSGTRKGAEGKHGHGEALDFKLEGVAAADLARFVRTYPRAGVGFYTHPKTQYVHVDVREHSYHWLDGSPPGVTWREQLLADPKQQDRDASYLASNDLPESAR
jgi:uncharacterized protein YcbK (DUF882 family)